MNWIFLSLGAQFLWAITNHIDKYLVSKYFKGGTGAVQLFSSLIGLIVLPIIFFFNHDVLSVDLSTAFFMTVAGILFLCAAYFYFDALSQADASTVVPLFQLGPIWGFILGFIFLGETLNLVQVLGGLVIFLGSIGLTLEIDHEFKENLFSILKFSKKKNKKRKINFKSRVLLLMVGSSFFFSLNNLLFKYFAIDEEFTTVAFWEYVGFCIYGIVIFLFLKKARKEFLSVFNSNAFVILSINGLNELSNVVAMLLYHMATLLAPLALVKVFEVQSIFVFVLGVILTLLFPKFINEDMKKESIIQKIIFTSIIILGIVIVETL